MERVAKSAYTCSNSEFQTLWHVLVHFAIVNLLAKTLLVLTTTLYKLRTLDEGIESVMAWESIAQQPSVDGWK